MVTTAEIIAYRDKHGVGLLEAKRILEGRDFSAQIYDRIDYIQNNDINVKEELVYILSLMSEMLDE